MLQTAMKIITLLQDEYGLQAQGKEYSDELNNLFREYDKKIEQWNEDIDYYITDLEFDHWNADELKHPEEPMSEDFLDGSELAWLNRMVRFMQDEPCLDRPLERVAWLEQLGVKINPKRDLKDPMDRLQYRIERDRKFREEFYRMNPEGF